MLQSRVATSFILDGLLFFLFTEMSLFLQRDSPSPLSFSIYPFRRGVVGVIASAFVGAYPEGHFSFEQGTFFYHSLLRSRVPRSWQECTEMTREVSTNHTKRRCRWSLPLLPHALSHGSDRATIDSSRSSASPLNPQTIYSTCYF